MEDFDIRARAYQGDKLRYLTRVGGYVICQKYRRVPFAVLESVWLKLKPWDRNENPPAVVKAKPENVATVWTALEAAGHARISELAKTTGLAAPTVNRILVGLHAQQKVYIWDIDVGPHGFERTRVYALGNEPDAESPAAQSPKVHREKVKQYIAEYEARKPEKKATQSEVLRDPLTAAFFGVRQVSTDALAALPSHVYKQAMDVSDELEAA